MIRRAAALVQNARSERAVAGLGEVHRLLTAYGLVDDVLLDLGEVRGFDYYSGVNFEGYVDGFGAELVGGGRYDQMLGRFGTPCPATGFAFDVNRLLLALAAQGLEPRVAGPEFFVIDFTEDKATALALCRRLRELGLAVARDIMSRPLERVARLRARHPSGAGGGDRLLGARPGRGAGASTRPSGQEIDLPARRR